MHAVPRRHGSDLQLAVDQALVWLDTANPIGCHARVEDLVDDR
jgi:hypothetical protein